MVCGKMEHEWTQEIVIPYLYERYHREVASLSRWTKRLGGIALALAALAGDPRITKRSGPPAVSFSIPCAFETWVEELANCKKLWESRLALARQMYFADALENCLEILRTISGADALQPGVRSCEGHALTRLGEFEEALGIAESMLAEDRSCSKAWSLRGDVLREQKRWTELQLNCCEWEKSAMLEKSDLRKLLWYRVVACCALFQDDEVEAEFEKYLATLPVLKGALNIERIRRRIFQCAGRKE